MGKRALKWIIPNLIVGLSNIHLPKCWPLKSVNAPLRLPGGWMKPISKSRANWFIYIESLIILVTPLISYSPNTVMKRRLQPSSNKPSMLTGSLIANLD